MDAANAHQDLEMPGPVGQRGPQLLTAVNDGRVSRDAILPLDATRLRSVAMIGHNAEEARTQGGGSATVMPKYTVSPLEGLRKALPDDVGVSYVRGAKVAEGLQAFGNTSLRSPVSGVPGICVTFLAEDGSEISGEDRLASHLIWFGIGIPDGAAAIRMQADWTAETAGVHQLGVGTVGQISLTLDGDEVFTSELEDDTDFLGVALFDPPTKGRR